MTDTRNRRTVGCRHDIIIVIPHTEGRGRPSDDFLIEITDAISIVDREIKPADGSCDRFFAHARCGWQREADSSTFAESGVHDPVLEKLLDVSEFLHEAGIGVNAGLDSFARVDHGRVIATTKSSPDGLQ